MSINFQNNDSPFNANGRFGRLSYLGWNGLLAIATIICIFVLTFLLPQFFSEDPFSPLIIIIFMVTYTPLIYFTFVFSIRRLHDLNVSGWASLLLLFPILNIILALSLALVSGENEENQYGSPRATATWEKIFAWLYILILPLGILFVFAFPDYLAAV